MKRITISFVLITILLIMIGCNQKNVKSDRNNSNLSDKVKSVRTYQYEAVVKYGSIYKGDRKIGLGFDIYNIFSNVGNLIEENMYLSDGSLINKYTYKYDGKGNKIEKYIYGSDGSLDSKCNYRKGNMIEEDIYGSDGSLNSKYTYKYDGKGNKIEDCWYNSYGLLCKYTNKYDEKGNKIEIYFYNGLDHTQFKSTLKYDEKGNNIEIYAYGSDGSLESKTTVKYDYNKYGDWVKRISFKNDIAEYIIEREIEYFK